MADLSEMDCDCGKHGLRRGVDGKIYCPNCDKMHGDGPGDDVAPPVDASTPVPPIEESDHGPGVDRVPGF